MTLPMGRALREVFGQTVSDLANSDPRILMLDADTGSSTKADVFQKAHPELFLQMGIAEQNMLGLAAGLATTGFVPFVSTFVAFAVVRPLDQIRVLIAQTGLNVKICGGYAGLFTGVTGKIHLIVDDLSIMRAMPGMVTVAPADDIEADQVLRWAANYHGPVYIRLVRDATQRLFDEKYAFDPGRAVVVRDAVPAEAALYWEHLEKGASADAFLAGIAKQRVVTETFRDGFFPYEGVAVKEFFERLKGEVSPDLILTHRRGDLHQDHRLVAELTWNTFRNHLILEYEIPKVDGDLGTPNFFVSIPR